MTDQTDDLLPIIVKEEFIAFIQAINPSWDIPDFHVDIAFQLQNQNSLVISMPPDHAKSTIASILYPAWFWGNHPEKKIILAVGAPKLVSSFAIEIRRVMESEIYKSTFDIEIRTDSDSLSMRHSAQGGSLAVVSKGAGISGLRADLIIFDDIISSAAEAKSQTNRDSAWDFITRDLFTRATPNAKKIGIGTRWHDDDVLSRLEKNSEFKHFTNIKYPALKDGKALWPERHDVADLMSTKAILGTHAFEALYQQNPIPQQGGLFKRQWFQFYSELPTPERIVQSWDCAQKVGITNDFSVCSTWAVTRTGYFLLDLWRQRVEAPQLEQAAQTLYAKFQPHIVLIEDKSSGSSLIQSLKQKTRMPIIPYDPKQKDKEVRASAATPIAESGKVFLPLNKPFVEDFIMEMERFPNAEHDDQVDSFTQMIEFFRTPTRNLRATWI